MHDHLRAACDEHGIILRRDALELGYDDGALYRALRSGVLHRIRHGAYVFADQWAPLDAGARHRLRARAVVRTAQAPVALSHVSALVMTDAPLWDLPLADVHLTRLDRRAGRREAGVVQHRGAITSADLVAHGPLQLTSPARTAVDLTKIVDVEHALPVLDHLLNCGATTPEQLRATALAMQRHPATLATDLAIRLADGRSESVGESRSRYAFFRGGLPAPVAQLEVHDGRGRLVGRVDFAWPELGVFLEFDGKEKYLRSRRAGESVLDVVLREKRREERICRITGWRCIRIVWADLYQPEKLVAHIASVLAGGPVFD